MSDELTTLRPQQPSPLPHKLGKYEIRREVGRGAMGVVYEAFDPVIQRRVALKTLVTELSSSSQSETYLKRLQREAQAAGRLTHPNIVAVYDFGEEPLSGGKGAARIAFIAMEFVDGRELESCLHAGERFEVPAVVRIMGQLLDALEYSHKAGVVHRDIKPGNIMLLADGSIKVADFGIARVEASTLTQTGMIMGSPTYMSPEQLLGQTVDARSDLYSAGVVLYKLLTGEVPFSGSLTNVTHKALNDQPSPPSILNVHVPKTADALLARALAKRPAERFQSAAEFKQALLRNLGDVAGTDPGAQVAATPSRQATLLRKAPSHVATHAALIAGACVLAAAAAAGVWYMKSRTAAERANASPAPPAVAVTPAGGAPAGPGAESTALAQVTAPPDSLTASAKFGTAVISAVGLADPQDPRFGKEQARIEHQLWGDARRQLIAKAAALYIEPSSIDQNYALLREKLFSRSDQYITAVLEQTPPTLSRYGLLLGTMRATVNVHDVQKSLNEISREDRVAFIRNNGNPTVAVYVRVQRDEPGVEPQRSAVAENVLMERIRAFGFTAVDAPQATPPPDFVLSGEVKFKHLAGRLPASGLIIEKVVLTSWATRVVDDKTGEVVYLNTEVPEKKSWASEESALKDVGNLIGSEFSRDFFLQYFDSGTTRARLRFLGLPSSATASVLREANAAARILNATPVGSSTKDVVMDVDLSAGTDDSASLVQAVLLNLLNRKLGKACFAMTGEAAQELRIQLDRACATDAVLGRLDTSVPEALVDAPRSRIEDIVSNPARLRSAAL